MTKRFILWLPLLLVLIFVLYFIVNTDHNNYLPQQRTYPTKPGFILKNHLKLPDTIGIIKTFPYEIYLDSADTWNISSIKNDLKELDNTYHDQSANREALSEALSHRLYKRYEKTLETYHPDTLIYLIQWAERFRSYAMIEPDNEIFYNSVYDDWLKRISNLLPAYSTGNSTIRYSYKYKYIFSRCTELKFAPTIEVTKMEKVMDNIVQRKWAHLIESSWNQTSVVFKILVLLIFIITLYGYYCIIKKHFIK